MSSGIYVALLEEIRLRLATATGVGNPLSSIKAVHVGAFNEGRKADDLPLILITLDRLNESSIEMPRIFVSTFDITLRLICSTLIAASGTNTLYNFSSSNGPLYLFEDLLNVIDKKIDGSTIDIGFNSKTNSLRDSSTVISYENGTIVFESKITVDVKKYQAGGR